MSAFTAQCSEAKLSLGKLLARIPRLNCLPFLGPKAKFEKWEVFLLAGRHDEEVRRKAVDLFSRGRGKTFVANRLGLSRIIMEQWLLTCRAVGSEALLAMGTARRKYDFETKVEAGAGLIRVRG